jgi:hypothetical protein
MLLCSIQTSLICLSISFHTDHLSFEKLVKLVDMSFCPFHACREHTDWEAGLEDDGGMLDHGKVNVRDLVDVRVDFAVEDDLSVAVSVESIE